MPVNVTPQSPTQSASAATGWQGILSAYLPLTQTRLVALGNQLTGPFSMASEQFWEQAIHLHFLGILAQAESYFLPGQQVFVAEHPLPNHPEVVMEVRLSRSGCQWLLASILGESPADNDESLLNQLTSLETDILDGWCSQLFAATIDELPMPNAESTLGESASTLDFLWMIGQPGGGSDAHNGVPISEEGEFGKLILRMPKSYLRYFLEQEPPVVGAQLAQQSLHHALPVVTIGVGNTRLTLEDIDAIEPGDVLYLEDSDLDTLYVQPFGEHQDAGFEARITLASTVRQQRTLTLPHHIYDETNPNPAEDSAMSPTMQPPNNTTSTERFWQNVHIDVHAAFEPVRIPLLELQQLSEGLIMEVGDLTRNTIHLQVDGKSVATGELVIIGDKFGVRVNQVEGGHAEQAPPPIVADLKPVAKEVEPDTMAAPEEEPMAISAPIAPADDDTSMGMPIAASEEPVADAMPMAVESDDPSADDDDDDW